MLRIIITVLICQIILAFALPADPQSSPLETSVTLKDPCGPKIQDPQDPTIANNSCTSVIGLVTAPSTFGAQLLNDGSGLQVAWENCLPTEYDVCTSLTSPSTPVGVWNWTDIGSECVMGFWLPQYPGSAQIPTVDVCRNNIYGAMAQIGQTKGGTAYNQVVVNLAVLPDEFQTGEAVNVGYPSYTISYLPLIKGNETQTPATKG